MASDASQSEVCSQYALASALAAGSAPIAVLHIGAWHSAIATGHGETPETVVSIAIGTCRTVTEFFAHNPPAPAELEAAIMAVEDALAALRDAIPAGARLFSADAELGVVARSIGIDDAPPILITRDAVELAFQRLAAIAEGRPATGNGLPADNAIAATMLILRECVHHLGFESITLLR